MWADDLKQTAQYGSPSFSCDQLLNFYNLIEWDLFDSRGLKQCPLCIYSKTWQFLSFDKLDNSKACRNWKMDIHIENGFLWTIDCFPNFFPQIREYSALYSIQKFHRATLSVMKKVWFQGLKSDILISNLLKTLFTVYFLKHTLRGSAINTWPEYLKSNCKVISTKIIPSHNAFHP